MKSRCRRTIRCAKGMQSLSKRLPMGVVNLKTGGVRFVPLADHRLLRMCSGVMDADSVLFSEEDRARLLELEKMGVGFGQKEG